MTAGASRERSPEATRIRILDVAREVLGQTPDAGMGDVAVAAGVVRRTVYGHFPTRADLVRTLAAQAADEIAAVLRDVDDDGVGDGIPADAVWAAFVERLWPLADRYRVLLALRRGEYGDDIHALLTSVDRALADLIGRGQDAGAFGRHLPPEVLGQIAYAIVFSLADGSRTGASAAGVGSAAPAHGDFRPAAVTSLLVLGVPGSRARRLAGLPPQP